MEVYIPISYFSIIESLIESVKKDFFNGKAANLNAIYNLLNALPIKCDISKIEVNKIAKTLIGNKQPNSFKEQIIWNAIKNQRLSFDFAINEAITPLNYRSFYFFDKENTTDFATANGIVCHGTNYTADKFYANCTVSDLKITSNWDEIKIVLPPTNAMLIIDPYILTPDRSSAFKKIESLVKFIKLYKADITIPFHLTIISETGADGIPYKFVNEAFEHLVNIGGCQVQICFDKKLATDDRRFFTNYTSGNFGHPFDRDTVFNQNFLGNDNDSTKIRADYKQYKIELEKWFSVLKSIPPRIGLVQCKWENSVFINRLFDQ